MSSHSPCLPPKIWGEIIEHLEDETPTLAAATRVCRVWLAPAAAVLWREPEPRALDVYDPTNARARAIYAPAVQFLSIEYTTKGDVLGRWHFPGARQLHYDNRREKAAPNTRLAALALERCGPRLARARIGTFDSGWLACDEATGTADDPDAHLKSCIGFGMLALLAQRPRPTHPVFDSHVTRPAMQRCWRSVARPFAELTMAQLSLRAPHAPHFVALMQHAPLAVLRLHVLWVGPFVEALARLRHLRDLSLMWQYWAWLSADEFVCLGDHVPELQVLRLTYQDVWSDDLAQLPLSDEDIRAVVAHLPNLVELTIEATAQFTSCSTLRGRALPSAGNT